MALKIKVVNVEKKLIEKIMPRDIIAIIVLIGCFILLAMGIDSFIAAVTTAVIGYYFSKRVYEEKEEKK